MQIRIFMSATTAIAAAGVALLLVYLMWPTSSVPPAAADQSVPAKSAQFAGSSRGSAASHHSVSAEKYSVEADGMVEVPARYRMPGVARVHTAVNLQSWLEQFPLDVQEKMTEFNERNFGVYSIDSRQQIAWMAAHGYPLPEDLAAAEKLSNADLRELANRGNEKAGFLLRERNIDALKEKFAEYAAKGLSRQRFWESDPDGPRLEQENKNDRALIAKSWSPFKGYMQAQDALLQDAGGSPHEADAKVMAGLALAEYLGDARADSLVLAYAGTDPVRQAIYLALQNATSNQGSIMKAMLDSDCVRVASDTIPP